MADIYLVSHSISKRLFWILLVANIIFIFWSQQYLSPLNARDVVRFEVSKTMPAAEAIIQGWKDSGKFEKALQAIYLDYFFIILYTSGLAMACIFLSNITKHEILSRAGKIFSFLLIGAGTCDVIENISMTQSVQGHITHLTVALAYDMAMAKFSVVILSFLFILVCLLFVLLNKIK